MLCSPDCILSTIPSRVLVYSWFTLTVLQLYCSEDMKADQASLNTSPEPPIYHNMLQKRFVPTFYRDKVTSISSELHFGAFLRGISPHFPFKNSKSPPSASNNLKLSLHFKIETSQPSLYHQQLPLANKVQDDLQQRNLGVQ